jgi:hypothetical protein
MLKDDLRPDEQSADQPVTDVPARKRRRAPPKASTTAAGTEKSAAQTEALPKRGRGRPKGSPNKMTIEREKVREMLDKSGPKKLGIKREPKAILLDAANFFMDRAEFLSDHAKRLAHEEAGDAAIKAALEECERQVEMASKCAERAAPYYHGRVGPELKDGDAIVPYVAWLPMPAPTAEQWAATRVKPNGEHGGH